jgi:hypothetical protein
MTIAAQNLVILIPLFSPKSTKIASRKLGFCLVGSASFTFFQQEPTDRIYNRREMDFAFAFGILIDAIEINDPPPPPSCLFRIRRLLCFCAL